MNAFKTYRLYAVLLLGVVTFSCLEDKGYTDIINGTGNSNVILSWYGGDGTPNNKTVALPAGEEAADYEIGISVTSSHKLNEDYTVMVGIDEAVINLVNQSITKESDKFFLLPDSTFDLPSLSATIPKDTTEAPFIVTFYQNKIDKSKNYMLPLKIQDQEGAVVSGNAGTIKLTFIGNPLAGAWLWDFKRYNTQLMVGSPVTTWEDEATVFSPIDAVSFKVPTGYYVQPNYLITFKNNGGVLSNFKAVIAPDEIKAAFTDNGISVIDGPNIIVNSDNTEFTINYTVFNGTTYRYLIDKFHK